MCFLDLDQCVVSFLLRCTTRSYELGTQCDSNSIVEFYLSSLLNIIRPEVP